jgi:hypothetical protein
MQAIRPYTINDINLLSTNVPEADYPIYNQLSTYAINETLIYLDTNKHWVIRSLVADNIGNIPTGLDSDTKWVKVSETNRWKMFDLKTTSQTINAGSIDVTIGLTSITNALYVGNVQGATLTVIGKDQYDVEIYNNTLNLVSTDGIYDPWTYFFNPIEFIEEVVLDDLPPYALSDYQITVSSPSGNVAIGTTVLGYIQELALTRYGMTMSSIDYSIKQANEFGDFVITERGYSRTVDLNAYVPTSNKNSIISFMNRYRATPIVWIGSGSYLGSISYGFVKNYEVTAAGPNETRLQIKIEGLS